MANSLLSCNSRLGLTKHPPPPQSSLIGRRSLILPPISFPAPPPTIPSGMQLLTIQTTAPADQESMTRQKDIISGDSPSAMNLHDETLMSSLSNIPAWAKVVLGAVVILAIPFRRKLIKMKGITIPNAEEVIEAVEKAAEMAEKLAEEASEALPDGSRLKEGVLRLEKIALLVDKDAELAESFIRKIDDAVEELETNFQPLVDRREMEKDGGQEEKFGSKKAAADDHQGLDL